MNSFGLVFTRFILHLIAVELLVITWGTVLMATLESIAIDAEINSLMQFILKCNLLFYALYSNALLAFFFFFLFALNQFVEKWLVFLQI